MTPNRTTSCSIIVNRMHQTTPPRRSSVSCPPPVSKQRQMFPPCSGPNGNVARCRTIDSSVLKSETCPRPFFQQRTLSICACQSHRQQPAHKPKMPMSARPGDEFAPFWQLPTPTLLLPPAPLHHRRPHPINIIGNNNYGPSLDGEPSRAGERRRAPHYTRRQGDPRVCGAYCGRCWCCCHEEEDEVAMDHIEPGQRIRIIKGCCLRRDGLRNSAATGTYVCVQLCGTWTKEPQQPKEPDVCVIGVCMVAAR